MEKKKIINGYWYIEDDEITFISLYDEKKRYYETYLFKDFIRAHAITESKIVLSNDDNGVIVPLFNVTYKNNQKVHEADFEDVIKFVYDICIQLTKNR